MSTDAATDTLLSLPQDKYAPKYEDKVSLDGGRNQTGCKLPRYSAANRFSACKSGACELTTRLPIAPAAP